MAVNTNETSLARPLLTSCCAAQFLTGHGSLSVHGPGVGDPWFKDTQLRTQQVTKTYPEPCSPGHALCSLNQMPYTCLKGALFSNLHKGTNPPSRGPAGVLSCIIVVVSKLLLTIQQLH